MRSLAALLALLLAGAVAAAALRLRGDSDRDGVRHPQPVREAQRPDREPPLPRRPVVAQVLGAVAVRARPGGPVVARLGPRTDFGSKRVLGVVRVRGRRWLAVTTPELGNEELGWIDARAAPVRVVPRRLELEADLSRRELLVLSDGEVVRRMTVGIGRSGSETPIGRFGVTDKLDGPEQGPWYGCCILALSGRQPNLPEGWEGGDRLAIHGRPADAGVGGAFSAGCLYAAEKDLRFLMARVPLGTLVTIHP